eukprot:TRINITY_DN13382_c0_g1_i1.p1 TRINITY_DN13382_c0_g1~~TRINITY_DN13382_c0_g1_i1.p1  ORF type:complete len:153 (+),score=31.65 TRINITY_DN13382_c0_g1_i1:60-518(+)
MSAQALNEKSGSLSEKYEQLYQKRYTDFVSSVKNFFRPHYDLYEKLNVRDKVACYEKNAKSLDQYYTCVTLVEERETHNANSLRKKLGKFDQQNIACKNSCKEKYQAEIGNFESCLSTCFSDWQSKCDEAYTTFYASVLSKDPQYKSLIKHR